MNEDWRLSSLLMEDLVNKVELDVPNVKVSLSMMERQKKVSM